MGRRKSRYFIIGLFGLTKESAEGTISAEALKYTDLRKKNWAVWLSLNHARIRERSDEGSMIKCFGRMKQRYSK